jgi:GNAT superfamily N-acetyltransferase
MNEWEPRRANAEDVGAIASTLARAFQDDPVAAWACPPEQLRPQLLERFFSMMVRMLLAGDEVWTLAGHEGAAVWAPPGGWRVDLREALALAPSLVHPRVAWRLPLIGAGLARIERLQPEAPHFYLADLGTDPDRQGQGVGSALLRPTLAFCDRERVGAYLECSKERNIDFYARHGFRVQRPFDFPRGPRVWLMWREPVA